MEPPEPLNLPSDYQPLANRADCRCSLVGYGDYFYKVKLNGWTNKYDVLGKIDTQGNSVGVSEATGKWELPGGLFSSKPQIGGKIDKDRRILTVNFVNGQSYAIDLNTNDYPNLFKTGFVFGNLSFMDAMDLEQYLYVALSKPGRVMVFRVDKSEKRLDNLIFETTFKTKNAIGQIFSILGSSSTDYVAAVGLIPDQSGNFYIGFTEQQVSRSGDRISSEILAGTILLYDSKGQQTGVALNQSTNIPYNRLTVFGNHLVQTGFRGHFAQQTENNRSLNKNTGQPSNLAFAEYITATNDLGAVFYDPGARMYYFKKH